MQHEEQEKALSRPRLTTGPLRIILLTLGWLFVALGTLGTVLPVLPTTPFLIVAAACFARSSTHFYDRLIANRIFGPLIRTWRETRSIPRRSKVIAIVVIIVVGGFSVAYGVSHSWLKIVVSFALLIPIGFFILVPTTEAVQDRTPGADDNP